MIPLFTVNMPPREELMPRLEEVLYSGYIGQGPKVEEFEYKFGEYIGNPNVLSLNSGTSALHLAYRLAGVEGGEVITTPMTCTATNMPILANGADIVWADVDPTTGMLDPEDVRRKITPRTRAITVVHWGGQVADIDALREIARGHHIYLIEDAAHALGATYRRRMGDGVSEVARIGNGSADFTCFSLQAIKHITTIDGGVLAVRDPGHYRRGKLLRWYGIDRETPRTDFRCEDDIKEWGYKFHMNDVNATIGIVQLEHLDEILEKHRENAAQYEKWLLGYAAHKPKWSDSASWWLYTLRIPVERERFFRIADEWGVQVSRVHARNDTHTAFQSPYPPYQSALPGVDQFSSEMACIPVHSKLTPAERTTIMQMVSSYEHQYMMGL